MANTKLSVYVGMPAAEKFAIYDRVSPALVQVQKVQGKTDPESLVLLENHLVINEANNGKPFGYDLFLQMVKDIVVGKLAYKGITADSASVYGTINIIGTDFLQQRKQTR